MTRRIFISYQHHDHLRAHGLNLMTYNKNVNVDFTGRHLLQPVNSTNADYISRKIRDKIKGSSATIVLVGKHTSKSDWVEKEITWSKEAGKGIIGIRIDPGAEIPQSLIDNGAEILDWLEPDDVNQFDAAIERAISATNRAKSMPLNSPSTCGR